MKQLEELNKAHLDEGLKVMQADNGAAYPFDILTTGVLNRSMSLTSGFVTLMRKENYLAAVTLVRPQLDTFLRYAAGWLVADPHIFATEILEGKPVKDMKTRDGARMTDGFLADYFSSEYSWIANVYKETCGFIHLSEKHLLINVKYTNSEERTPTFTISDRHPHTPMETRAEAVLCLADITKAVLHRVYSWRCTKENPPGRPNESQQKAAGDSASGTPEP